MNTAAPAVMPPPSQGDSLLPHEQLLVSVGITDSFARFSFGTLFTAAALQLLRPAFAFEKLPTGASRPRPFGSPVTGNGKEGGVTPTYFTWWSVSLGVGAAFALFL